MMKKKTIHIGSIFYIVITGILFLFPKDAYAQYNYIRNGTLNGIVGNSQNPFEWYVCDSYSSPDMYSRYIPNPRGSGDEIFPVRDSTFLFLRTRSKYHTNPPGPYTYEYIIQHLRKPLEKGSTFLFSCFYCFSSHLVVQDLHDPNIAYPVRLELWAGNDSCADEKLLMQTEPLQDPYWTERHCTFTLPDTSYAYIRIAAQWDSMTMSLTHESYNGMILIDSLSIYKLPGLDTLKTFDLYYKGDGKTTLNATKGTSYSWTPQVNLSAYNVQSPIMQGFTPQYTVAIGSLTTCSYMEIFNILLNCDTLYPIKDLNSFNIYYSPHKKVYLNASDGNKYSWYPFTNLSDTNVCCPYLTGYDSTIKVTVWDKYNCPFNQKFNEILNCDTIIPNKYFLSLDTALSNQNDIQLVPEFGEVDSTWNPDIYLSCQNCREPKASPVHSISYQVKLKDEFGCIHHEIFKITIELFVPNVITPNGDDKNERFVIKGLPENTSVKIYTKNGVLVYSAKPYIESNFWEGRDNSGKLLESNNYWYVIENPEKGLYLRGFVFLLR
jgi:gliding motility-associated-like protein